ncbi:acyl-CoA dehydrogenase family protein [Allorhizocola rhizosphaerae]|uniref:acyl-CoA dehydrogenase family protein n=1 Tax=Allorhizocola rhizosphaerae TaxID=1872709 RepID=UPI001B8D56DD|nr:acyl-CoA dehydrogenase family protein [Allorhizocola rhizosphaerae]
MNELRDTVRAVLRRHPGQAWEKLCAEVGVTGLAIPEEHGGAGAGLPEVHAVLEELGRDLTPHRLHGTTLASQALLQAGDTRWLKRIADGSVTAALALDGEPYTLDAPGADVVVASHNGRLYEATVTRSCTALDESRALGVVEPDLTRPIGSANAGRLREIACVLLSAEQVGAAARALEITVEYTKTRVQFGRPIGAFQALQHRMADLHVAVEAARAVSRAAVAGQAHPSVAKVVCSETLMRVAGEMIQLHGGIGITWEHSAHRYFKRAHGSWHLYGTPDAHVKRLAAARLD